MSQPTVRVANRNSECVFQNAAVATGNGTALTVEGASACLVQINGITTATVTFEGSVDETNYVAVQVLNMATGGTATTTTVDGLFHVNCTGLHLLRCRISAWTSGTITVKGRATTVAVLGSGGGGSGAATTTAYTETAGNSAAGGTLITLAAVAGQKHRVFGYDVSAAGTTTITIADGATTLQRHFLGPNGGVIKDPMPSGTAWFTGTANTALTVASSAAVDVSVRIYTTTAA
jgi:hypothetical protein